MWINNYNNEFNATNIVKLKWLLDTRREYIHKACFAAHSRNNKIGRLDQLRILGALKQYLAFTTDTHPDPNILAATSFLDECKGPILAKITEDPFDYESHGI